VFAYRQTLGWEHDAFAGSPTREDYAKKAQELLIDERDVRYALTGDVLAFSSTSTSMNSSGCFCQSQIRLQWFAILPTCFEGGRPSGFADSLKESVPRRRWGTSIWLLLTP
jgi:hypothetical protein